MPISASNHLKGTISKIVKGTVSAEVQIELACGEKLTAVITTSSVERMGLKEGQPANAVVKATSVMVETE
jgi:molybdopterin-binding protein